MVLYGEEGEVGKSHKYKSSIRSSSEYIYILTEICLYQTSLLSRPFFASCAVQIIIYLCTLRNNRFFT